MLYFNNLQAECTNFPSAGKQLCIPHKCEIYTVSNDDTCHSIKEFYNNIFTISQLVSWNVDINRGCNNLEMLVGNQICVSFPGNASAPSITDTPVKQTTNPLFHCKTSDGKGHVVVDENCYVNTYPTLPPWTFTPVNTTSIESTGSPDFSWSNIEITPVSSLTTVSYTPNPTPTPFIKSMVSNCTNFIMARGKILPYISCDI